MKTSPEVEVHDDVSFLKKKNNTGTFTVSLELVKLIEPWEVDADDQRGEKEANVLGSQVLTQRKKKKTWISNQCYHHRLCGVAKSCWVMFGFWHWMLFRHTKRSTWWLTLSIFLMLFFSFTNNLITTTFCNHKTTKKPNGKPQHTRPIFIKLSMKWLF